SSGFGGAAGAGAGAGAAPVPGSEYFTGSFSSSSWLIGCVPLVLRAPSFVRAAFTTSAVIAGFAFNGSALFDQLLRTNVSTPRIFLILPRLALCRHPCPTVRGPLDGNLPFQAVEHDAGQARSGRFVSCYPLGTIQRRDILRRLAFAIRTVTRGTNRHILLLAD